MSDVLNPNFLNYPEQVQKNKKDIEMLNKVYKTTQNLTSSTTTININTTNIVDLNNCIIDRFLFSRNGLLFKIKSYTNETLYIEFYSDLSSTNEVITNFEFNPDVVVYENGNARIVGTIKYNQDSLLEPVEAPAEINLPMIAGEGIVIDANEENDKLEIHIENDTISNPNLLINGDFRVNQRNQTSYGQGYTVDRWRVTNNVTTLTVVDNGVELSSTTSNGYMQQLMENAFNKLKGKIVTYSVCINGQIYSKNGIVPNSLTSSTQSIAVIGDSEIYTAVGLYVYANGNIFAQIGVKSGRTINIEWVKLEIGSVATAFSPRPYAEELELCKRYFLRLNFPQRNINTYVGFNESATKSRFFIPCNLRTSPTLFKYSALADFQINTSGSPVSPTAISTHSFVENGGVGLEFTASGLTAGDGSMLYINTANAYIELDSEIY